MAVRTSMRVGLSSGLDREIATRSRYQQCRLRLVWGPLRELASDDTLLRSKSRSAAPPYVAIHNALVRLVDLVGQ